MLTYDEIQGIFNQKNLVLRNLQVTQGYYCLTQGMRKVIGSSNVNWPAFATHASKTAGYAIRQEVLPGAMTQPLLRIAGFRQTADFLNRCMIIDREDNRPCFNNRPGEQQNSTLYQAPFSPAQAAAIMVGRIPGGQL